MAIVETLEIRFQAEMGALSAQLTALAGQIMHLGTAMDAGQANLSANAARLVQSVAEGLRAGAGASGAPTQAGGMLAERFAQAIQAGGASAGAAAQNVVSAARFNNGGAVSAAQGAGAALGQGFANGINSKYAAVIAAANRIASAAVSRIRSALRIHSPSKVSFALGGYFGEGFADGVCDSIRLAEEGVQRLSSAAASALDMQAADLEGRALSEAALPSDWKEMEPALSAGEGISAVVQTALEAALGGTEVRIPLYVDGMQLGEASIRGINRVTRSAGRVLLEL